VVLVLVDRAKTGLILEVDLRIHHYPRANDPPPVRLYHTLAPRKTPHELRYKPRVSLTIILSCFCSLPRIRLLSTLHRSLLRSPHPFPHRPTPHDEDQIKQGIFVGDETIKIKEIKKK
jgi:hypothetical protein